MTSITTETQLLKAMDSTMSIETVKAAMQPNMVSLAAAAAADNQMGLDNKSTSPDQKSPSNHLASELLEKSTAMHSQAVPSSDGESQVDLASLPPLEGFGWKDLLWPEVGELDLTVMEGDKEIKLNTFRWPVPSGEQRKGVVFLIHGYGAHAGQMAVTAKFIAAEGFEVLAMDMRGHGDSQGFRGDFASADQVYNDQWAFIFQALRHYRINAQTTPIYVMGRSFGGLIATNMANTTIGKAMFKGVVLLSPYYRLFTEKLYETYKYLVPLCWVKPRHLFQTEYSEMDADYLARYKDIFDDKRNLNVFTASTAKLWVEMQEVARTSIQEAAMPICFIIAREDGVVRNDYIEDFASMAQHQSNEIYEIPGADHTDVCFDPHYCSHMIRATTAFLNKLTN